MDKTEITFEQQEKIFDQYPKLRILDSLRWEAIEAGLAALDTNGAKAKEWAKVASQLGKAARAYARARGII